MVWQIILKDSPIILFFIPKFSAHYSSIILKQHHAASQEFIAKGSDLPIAHV